jgi:deoxycytidylate deaminase
VVIVKNGKIIAHGANGSDYHEKHGCERKKQGIPTGEGYELCEGCHPKNHAEAKALKDARAQGLTRKDTRGSEVYLWGHWWCCQPCWEKMIAAGIKNVYLQENSQILFNRSHRENIL